MTTIKFNDYGKFLLRKRMLFDLIIEEARKGYTELEYDDQYDQKKHEANFPIYFKSACERTINELTVDMSVQVLKELLRDFGGYNALKRVDTIPKKDITKHDRLVYAIRHVLLSGMLNIFDNFTVERVSGACQCHKKLSECVVPSLNK
jgi:hypothetical protein